MCFHTGYRGRIGVFEILTVDHALRELIAARAPRDQLYAAVRKAGFHSLRDGCRELVLQGVTTAEEAYRTIHSSED